MRRGPVAAALLVMAGGVCLHAWGDSRELSGNAIAARSLTTNSTGPRGGGSIEATPAVGEFPHSPVLLSQADRTPPKKPHRVKLSWVPSVVSSITGENIVGYNVYRCTAFGSSWVKLNADPVVDPEYVDYHVRGGSTYYYATTAVSQSGNQSGFSNMVKVAIPYP
jgi:hypothetical protein